jgi:hypothetical protein
MGDDAFTKVWKCIKSHEGESFRTRRGLEFTYKISDDVFVSQQNCLPHFAVRISKGTRDDAY